MNSSISLYNLRTSALVKLKYLSWAYTVSLFITSITSIAHIILLFVNKQPEFLTCSPIYDSRASSIIECISSILQIITIIEMSISRQKCVEFINSCSQNPEVSSNACLKAFTNYLSHIMQYYTESRHRDPAPFFQVKDAFWHTNQIPCATNFYLAQFLGWIVFGIGAYLSLLVSQNDCSSIDRVARISLIFPYQILLLCVFAVGTTFVIISAILVIPVVVVTYIRYQTRSRLFTELSSDQSQELSSKQEKKLFISSQLEKAKYSEENAKDKMCSVCLESFKEKQIVSIAKCCRSVYHESCIKSWVQMKANCPTCRQSSKSKTLQPQTRRISPSISELQLISQISEISQSAVRIDQIESDSAQNIDTITNKPNEINIPMVISIEPIQRKIMRESSLDEDDIENQINMQSVKIFNKECS